MKEKPRLAGGAMEFEAAGTRGFPHHGCSARRPRTRKGRGGNATAEATQGERNKPVQGNLKRSAVQASSTLTRAVRLWTVAAPVAIKYTYLQAKGAEEWEWEREHERSAPAIAQSLAELGGFFSKCGQMLASRPDLVPTKYAQELAPLQDSMEPMCGSEVRAIVEEELLEGEALETAFSEFDFDPIGSASVAQVHRARLTSGQEVAVKVQRPRMEETMMGDASTLLAVSYRLRSQLNVDYYVVFSEMASQLEKEFDFIHEADAMDWTRKTLEEYSPTGSSPLRIPKSIPGMVTKRVLCMEFLPGTPISRLGEELSQRGMSWDSPSAQIVGRRLLRSLTDAYAIMLLKCGRFHGDPHGGNLLIDESGTPSLVDFGQMKKLPEEMRQSIARIILELNNCSDPNTDQCDSHKPLVSSFRLHGR